MQRSKIQYINKVLDSIRQNAIAVQEDEGDARILELAHVVRDFYASLFDKKGGAFRRRKLDKTLLTAPDELSDDDEFELTRSPVRPKVVSKGVGKGSPGRARKSKVTNRQQKLREKRGITASPAADSPDSCGRPPSLSPAKKRRMEMRQLFHDTGSESSRSPGRESSSSQRDTEQQKQSLPPDSAREEPVSTPPPPPPPPPPPAPIAPPKPRKILGPQTRLPCATKPVARMQQLFDGTKDGPANSGELSAMWTLMDSGWEKLGYPFYDAAAVLYHDRVLPCHDLSIADEILKTLATINGTTVCLNHLIGVLVKKHVDSQSNKDDESNKQAALENLETKLKCRVYRQYREVLDSCPDVDGKACDLCPEVVKFDDSYMRFHNLFESGEDLEELGHEPDLEKRPMHCKHADVLAQDLSAKYQGIGVSNLRKMYDFACSTPPLSPLAIATSRATDVITLATKYFQQFNRERRVDDPVPSSWLFERSAADMGKAENLIVLRKDSVHFYDADSAEITIAEEDEALMQRLGLERPQKIRVRARDHDAPEMEVAFRFYRQSDTSGNRMNAILTRHLGLEALRSVRGLVNRSDALMLYLPGDEEIVCDSYGRYLLDFVLKIDVSRVSLCRLTARDGYTLSVYTAAGIERSVDKAMRCAIRRKMGMFNLPGEVFAYPYRPWDIRRHWSDSSEDYNDYAAIMTVPDQSPAVAWQPPEVTAFPTATTETGDEGASDHFKYFFRVVESNLSAEGLCFSAASTIPGAGKGLFLKPHTKKIITRGQHLCLYAAATTTTDEIEAAGSSKDYAINVPRTNSWYDAEHFDGNNLGRFANQPNVLQSLLSIQGKSTLNSPPLTESDWTAEENAIDDICNCEFKCEKRQLVLVAKHDIEPSGEPRELFVNYGGLRTYWLPLLLHRRRDDANVPVELRDAANWFLDSEQCNWTAEQKATWAGVSEQ